MTQRPPGDNEEGTEDPRLRESLFAAANNVKKSTKLQQERWKSVYSSLKGNYRESGDLFCRLRPESALVTLRLYENPNKFK